MTFREIVGKIIGYYSATPKTNEELARQEDKHILAKINREMPAGSYFAIQDYKPVNDSYVREHSSTAVKALKGKLSTLLQDLNEH